MRKGIKCLKTTSENDQENRPHDPLKKEGLQKVLTELTILKTDRFMHIKKEKVQQTLMEQFMTKEKVYQSGQIK